MKRLEENNYLDLCGAILGRGTSAISARENIQGTIKLFGTKLEFDLSDGHIPLLTTKKMPFKTIVTELLWFIKGRTDLKYLLDHNCHIWDKNAWRYFQRHKLPYFIDMNTDKNGGDQYNPTDDFDVFIWLIQNNKAFESFYGDMGKIYGYQWRKIPGVDQLKNIFYSLKDTSQSRRHIIDSWTPTDIKEMALEPCHILYQFDVTGNKLNLQMYQRSVDTFLGLPFNIVSASILLRIMAQILEYTAGNFIWIGGDTHIYEGHIEQIKEQMTRVPFKSPGLRINKSLNTFEDIENLEIEDFILLDYKSHSALKGELQA